MVLKRLGELDSTERWSLKTVATHKIPSFVSEEYVSLVLDGPCNVPVQLDSVAELLQRGCPR